MFSSDDKFITVNKDRTVCLFIDGEQKKIKKVGSARLVDFINDEVVVATRSGKLTILNENLDINKEFTAGAVTDNSDPRSLSGNQTFIAVGNYAGVVRFYERIGEQIPMVRYKFKF